VRIKIARNTAHPCQRNQLNASLTWSTRQHRNDALTCVLRLQEIRTIIGTSSQDCSTLFLFFFILLILRLTKIKDFYFIN